MRLTKSSSFLIGSFIFVISWWYALQLDHQGNNINLSATWGNAQCSVILLGGLLGIIRSFRWGFPKSILSKALFFLSLGLVFWGVAGLSWFYYIIFLHIDVPYPSLADFGFILASVFWAIGMVYLALATGAKYGFRSSLGKFLVILLPIIVILLSYYFFIIIARLGSWTEGGGFIKVFLDFAYPVGDVVILTAALLIYGLSLQFLSGRYKWPVIIILLAFVIEFIGDFIFAYTTTVGTYANGGWVDVIFLIALFLLGFGINSFDHRPTFPSTTSPEPATNTQTPDTLLISHIIKAHEGLIGPIALEYAREIQGLHVYNLEHIEVTGDIKKVLEKLVQEYSSLFGKVAIEACKEEVKKIPSYPTDHLPGVLK